MRRRCFMLFIAILDDFSNSVGGLPDSSPDMPLCSGYTFTPIHIYCQAFATLYTYVSKILGCVNHCAKYHNNSIK